MATKKKAAPKRKPVRVVTASRDVLLRSALSKAEAERDRLRASLTAEREEHLKEELDLQKVADNSLHREKHLEGQIDVLAKMLVDEFGGPTQDESACEMAARLLREQRDKVEELEEIVVSCNAQIAARDDKIAKLEAAKLRDRRPGGIDDVPPERPRPITNADSASAQRFTREVGR